MCRYQKRHIALKLLYLGWNYDGFVVQDNTTNTIEDHLFKALIKGTLIENRASSNYHRCGRTDQGVSSFCQVRLPYSGRFETVFGYFLIRHISVSR